MKKKKILFRADGSSSIGFGHLFRCIALIEILQNNFECTLVTRGTTQSITKELESLCVKIIEIPALQSCPIGGQDFRVEVPFDLQNILEGNEIVVLDGYCFGPQYQHEIKNRGCTLVYIDDLVESGNIADVIINHSPGVIAEDYGPNATARFCLGYDYAILRSAFLVPPANDARNSTMQNLFVSFGGADPLNLSDATVTAIAEANYWKNIFVMVGSGYRTTSELKKKFNNHSAVKIYSNIKAPQVRELMLLSDAALVPASSVLMESLACRLFAIAGYYVENQRKPYNGLVRDKVVYGLGDFRTLDWSGLNWDTIASQKSSIERKNPIEGERILANYSTLFSQL